MGRCGKTIRERDRIQCIGWASYRQPKAIIANAQIIYRYISSIEYLEFVPDRIAFCDRAGEIIVIIGFFNLSSVMAGF